MEAIDCLDALAEEMALVRVFCFLELHMVVDLQVLAIMLYLCLVHNFNCSFLLCG